MWQVFGLVGCIIYTCVSETSDHEENFLVLYFRVTLLWKRLYHIWPKKTKVVIKRSVVVASTGKAQLNLPLGPSSRKSRDFSGYFGCHNSLVSSQSRGPKPSKLSNPLGFSYIKNMLKVELFKTSGLRFVNWLSSSESSRYLKNNNNNNNNKTKQNKKHRSLGQKCLRRVLVLTPS